MWRKRRKWVAISASMAMLLLMDPAFCGPANIKHGYFKSIPFQSPDRLGEYNVSGLWFPEGLVPFVGLSGPAIFVFKNVTSGKQWTVAVNAIALLDKDFWDKQGVADAAQLEPEALSEKLASFGVVSLSLSQDKRAKVGTCGRLISAPQVGHQMPSQSAAPDPVFPPINGAAPVYDAPPQASFPVNSAPPASHAGKAEKCLNLGDAVVDLQDIDFDGKQELVFRHAGLGQRYLPSYEVVRIPADGEPALGGDTTEPFSEIDGRTVINITRKQITIEGSNGACDNTEATYSRDTYGRMRMTHFWRGVWQEPDRCDAEDYAVEDQADGIGRHLKLLSRKSLN